MDINKKYKETWESFWALLSDENAGLRTFAYIAEGITAMACPEPETDIGAHERPMPHQAAL
jgi:hypothetical protein